ncbi:Stress-induced-phosphoprotein 1 [Orchesella cincta]|uniref:Stress-induced-phosphoprotein 1 n=1 Tax=Orchesella cincta TaxID=48709 RepID=A0A1D2MJ44_ORCCI|nr:Stress-induced-phosphoprotein 1 [Orchesella cincta]
MASQESGWAEMAMGKPWTNILRYVEMVKNPTNAESFAPPNFLHPFGDPELFKKLKNDRRTSQWLEDPEYVALMKEFQERPEAFDEKYCDPKFESKVVMTLRVLLWGKDGNAYGDKILPPGTGCLPQELFATWMGTLYSLEYGSIDKAYGEKDAGNVAYKDGNFSKALEHYNKAIAIYPYDMRFVMNVGAVAFETANYKECIQKSLDAVEVGRENSVNKRLIGKAFMRVGNSYRQLGDYENAKVYFKKSLDEHTSPEVASLLSEVEKLLDKQDQVSNAPNPAPESNEGGNELFRQGDYAGARAQYTKAIGVSSKDPKLFGNRAACNIKLFDWESAKADCDKCLELDPKYAQGWLMKALILQKQSSLAYQEAMRFEPSTVEAATGYEKCMSAINSALGSLMAELDYILSKFMSLVVENCLCSMSSNSVEIPNTPQSPSPTHIHVLSISSPSSAICPTATVSVNLNTPTPLLITPPKLTRCPTIPLTRIDVVKPQNIAPSPLQSEVPLPPPPPLIKMPISTRKEKRGAATKSSAESEDDKPQEPPRKRTRTGNSESESVPPARKIIQEIFGPDKSKKPKGRKRRRGVTTPKKKSPVKQERQDDVEYFEVKQEDEQNEHEPENEFEENKNDDEVVVVVEKHDNQVEENQEEEEDVHIKEEQIEDPVNMESQPGEVEYDNEVEVVADNQRKVEDMSDDDDDASKNEEDSDSATSISRVRIGRNAKRVANEKLKKISQQSESGSVSVEPETVVKDEEEEDDDDEEEETAGEIQSRRSTTEGSSKSSGSIAQAESESSSKHFYMDPQRNSPTPMSVMSEDEDHDMKEDLGETVSVSDLMDQKDSDVDSTYSWKPVRAAAAFAMEQVTKKQGGSVVLGDGEIKTGAAAERRARKVQRYKGRNRRTLLFKSSSSKQYTSSTVRKRWSAQPTIIPKIFHHGNYFQAGDVVFVEMEGDNLLHGQVSGILMDQHGEISAGIRWLAPACPIYALVDFDPNNYGIRYDVPEKLVKIEYLNFVMHLNPDYFQGHSSFRKIEKNSIYTRFGRSIHTYESDSDSSSDNEGSSNRDVDNSSTSENGSKSASVKIKKEEEDESDASEVKTKDRKRQYSGSSSESTDVDDEEEPTVSKNEESSKEDVPGRHQEAKEEEICPEEMQQAIDMDVKELNDNSEINSKEVESVESDNEI